MFPYRDHNPSRRTPYVTWALIALNVIVFVSNYGLMSDNFKLASFYSEYAMIPVLVSSDGAYQSILTSMFIHAGFMHILGNMLFLWIFGDNLEDGFGHIGFLVFYLLCGFGAAYAHVLSDPNSRVPVVGASGAIAGVMGGYLLLFPKARVDVLIIILVFFKRVALPAWVMLGVWFALQLFNGLTTDTTGGGVAYWAHAGGFVIGLALTFPYFLKRGGNAFWQQTEGHPPHPPTKVAERMSSVPSVIRRR